MCIDLRSWDQHETSTRINPNGTINVQSHELAEFRAKQWLEKCYEAIDEYVAEVEDICAKALGETNED